MKYKATITFEVDDSVKADEVYDMIESDLSSGEFFVKNEEFGTEHCKNICVHEVEKIVEKKAVFCPKCGSESEVVADDLINDGFVFCRCKSCKHEWSMNKLN